MKKKKKMTNSWRVQWGVGYVLVWATTAPLLTTHAVR